MKTFAVPMIAVAAAGLVLAQAPKPEVLAPYFPTPLSIVEQMLDLGKLKAGEKMFDLGSGDGRIIFMAAQRYGADATGVELDNDLFLSSQNKIRQLGLTKTARIIHGDILTQDYSSADLITVYLLPESNIKARPLLEKQLKKGTRIVAHDFPVGGWVPVKTVTIADDGEGRSHTLMLYIR
jgi:protein-L-isoaspartate O-methyltransferase